MMFREAGFQIYDLMGVSADIASMTSGNLVGEHWSYNLITFDQAICSILM